MEKLDIKLEKENNNYFREWIIEEWKHDVLRLKGSWKISSLY